MTNPNTAKHEFFEQNVGSMDRQARLVIGFAMILAILFNQPHSLGEWNLLLLAAIPVISSAILGWDPLYALFGKSNYIPEEDDIHQRNWTYSNLGIIDRGLRLAIGAMIIADVLLMGESSLHAALALLAIPIIATAIIAWDPIYALFNLNSFAARVDAEAAEPGVNEQTLAKYYEFPTLATTTKTANLPKAA